MSKEAFKLFLTKYIIKKKNKSTTACVKWSTGFLGGNTRTGADPLEW